MAKPSTPKPGYNGPGKDAYLDRLGKHIHIRFNIMRWMSKAAHNLAAWESSGGDKRDILDGYLLTKLTGEERAAEAMRINRVWAWHGVAKEEKQGQWSFVEALEPAKEQIGAGGHPLGSLPSVELAKHDGYQSGKQGHLNLSDNHWPSDTLEAGAWAEGFGMGMEDRPAPKPAKAKNGEADDEPKAPRKRGQRALPAPDAETLPEPPPPVH
jgi:hypothetical protein